MYEQYQVLSTRRIQTWYSSTNVIPTLYISTVYNCEKSTLWVSYDIPPIATAQYGIFDSFITHIYSHIAHGILTSRMNTEHYSCYTCSHMARCHSGEVAPESCLVSIMLWLLQMASLHIITGILTSIIPSRSEVRTKHHHKWFNYHTMWFSTIVQQVEGRYDIHIFRSLYCRQFVAATWDILSCY